MNPKKTSSKRSEQTRQRIIQYAGRVFFEKGFRKVTVEEICSGLSMSKRTYYKYFANRDALAEAVMVEWFMASGPILYGNLNSSKPVEQIINTHFDLLVNRIYSRISTQMLADFQVMFPETWQNIETARRQLLLSFADVVRRGQQEGKIRKDLDPEVTVRTIQGIATHLASPQFLLENGIELDAFIRNWQTLLCFGVLTSNHPEREPVNAI